MGRMMFRVLDIATKCVLAGLFAVAMLAHVNAAQASSFKVLHAFSGGLDGCYPAAGVILDGAGNLYGTTAGGAAPCNCGTVFKLSAGGAETPLYEFTCADGEGPDDGLVMDGEGNLYGATLNGGKIGCGVIFEVPAKGREKTLHDFAGPPTDGCAARGTLIVDAKGILYGTTSGGGKYGYGTIFKLSPSGNESVLYSFCRKAPKCPDGNSPFAGLIIDSAGNLYSTTQIGGGLRCQYGCGTVFKLAPGGKEIVLYKFKGSPNDGTYAQSPLMQDEAGDLYGTLNAGGRTGCYGNLGCGAVFELAPDGAESVLHFFTGENGDGANPLFSGVIQDGMGNLFGTTEFGGSGRCMTIALGCGTVFEVAPDGTETVLHTFGNGSQGANPYAGLVADSSGNLYGTTYYGGTDSYGTVFEILR